MRYLLIATAALWMQYVVATDAVAAGPGQGIQIVNNNYIVNDNNNYNQSSGRGVPYGRNPYYGYRGYDYGSQFETHNEAVARIRAIHSRYRTNYHPRSYYNSPPSYYGW